MSVVSWGEGERGPPPPSHCALGNGEGFAPSIPAQRRSTDHFLPGAGSGYGRRGPCGPAGRGRRRMDDITRVDDMTILGRTRTGGFPASAAEPGTTAPALSPIAAGPAVAAGAGAGATPDPAARTRSPEERRERRLFVSVLTLAFLVLAGAIALAFTLGAEQSGLPSLPVTPSAQAGHATGSANASGHGPPTTRASHRSTSSGSATGRAGTAPVATSLSPSQGAPGQTVTVSGSKFMSADGQIVAHFAGVTAATDCPVQTSCTVVVPTLAGAPRTVRVTVTSESGTSAGLTFSYK
jgi:hypothetical protein